MTDHPVLRFASIGIVITMASNYSQNDRLKLERAAAACQIKQSFDKEVKITVTHNYPKYKTVPEKG
jgi:hypothetical protein